MILEEIKKIIRQAVGKSDIDFLVEVPAEKTHGDYSSNVALVLSKTLQKNPREVAEEIKQKINSDIFSKIEIAGPGFLNFFVADKVFVKEIKSSVKANHDWFGQKIIIDYTDPNILKDFHIGHLMSNAIGESLSRLFEFEGKKVKRVCYQSDVGMGIAKAIWGKIKNANFKWGQAYAFGAQKYEEDETSKKEIIELNKKIYQRSDKNINNLYDQGKKESLDYFDKIYKKLGTKFDYFIFESQVGPVGKKIVEKNLGKVFDKGENGAIIFKGEKYGLHTRVFINSEGLPTYEAKDLGLAQKKYDKYAYDKSVIITGNEVNDYFKVMLCAMKKTNPRLAKKTKHIGHGMLRLPEGKMSSRTGKVITGEFLIEKVEELIKNKIKDRQFTNNEKNNIAEKVAIGAIKYSILKQAIGSDIIFDFDKSISFEGDSGPYLQYSYARALSVLEKAKKERIKASFSKAPKEVGQLEKSISRFSESVLKAEELFEPHFLVLYLTNLASEFNSYYAKNKIADKKDTESAYRVALVNSFVKVMKEGLWLLGIEALNKM